MPTNVPVRRMVRTDWTKSWLFNGTSSGIKTISTVDLSPYNKIVVDCWLYFPSQSFALGETIMELSSNYGAGTDRFWCGTVGASSGAITARMVTTAGEANVNVARPITAQWMHFLAVFDRSLPVTSATTVYINGVFAVTSTGGTGTLSGNFKNDNINIGSTNGASQFFNGNIKGSRIHTFTGTFAQNDAKAFFQGRTPSGYTLRANWNGEDTSTTAVDSVSAQNATLTNVSYDTTVVPSKARTASGIRTLAGVRTLVPILQNLCTYSEQMDNAIYTKSNTTITANNAANPINGTVDADLVTDDNVNTNHMIAQTFTPTALVGRNMCWSVYVKANTNQWLFFDTITPSPYFDLVNGVLGTSTALAGTRAGIEPVTGQTGWYRIWCSAPWSQTTGFTRIRMANSDGGAAYAGASNKSFWCWGWQVNEGMSPSAYTQTVATAVNTGTPRTQAY